MRNLNAKAGYGLHPWVPDLPVTPVGLADSFLRAKKNTFPDDTSLVLDRRRMTELYLSTLPFNDPEVRQQCFALIRSSLADSSELLAWYDSLDLTRYSPAAPRLFRAELPGFDGHFLTLDLTPFGIENVAAAAKFSANLLRCPEKEMPFDLPCFAERAHILSLQCEELNALCLNSGITKFFRAMLGRMVGKVRRKLTPWRRSA